MQPLTRSLTKDLRGSADLLPALTRFGRAEDTKLWVKRRCKSSDASSFFRYNPIRGLRERVEIDGRRGNTIVHDRTSSAVIRAGLTVIGQVFSS